MKKHIAAGDAMSHGLTMNTAMQDSITAPAFTYDIICADAAGSEKWRERIHNTVMTAGKNDMLDKYFKGTAYTAAWYLGLCGSGSISASDTLASHAGWSEVTPYTGNRSAITFGTTSSGSNTATAVNVIINATATVAGAFIASVSSGTSGILYSAASFAATRSVASGDTLSVTPTVSVL